VRARVRVKVRVRARARARAGVTNLGVGDDHRDRLGAHELLRLGGGGGVVARLGAEPRAHAHAVGGDRHLVRLGLGVGARLGQLRHRGHLLRVRVRVRAG